MGFLATTFFYFIGPLTYEYTPNASPLKSGLTLLRNSRIVGNFAHQFKGAVFTPVLKGADTQVVHTHSLIVGAVADHIPLKQGLRLLYLPEYCTFRYRRRPYSIKTRIKTMMTN